MPFGFFCILLSIIFAKKAISRPVIELLKASFPIIFTTFSLVSFERELKTLLKI